MNPCLVHVEGHLVRIQRLELVDEGQAAQVEGRQFHDLGLVRKATRVRDGMFVTVWSGEGPRGTLTGATKKEVIELLLEAHGFYEAEPNATNPGLF